MPIKQAVGRRGQAEHGHTGPTSGGSLRDETVVGHIVNADHAAFDSLQAALDYANAEGYEVIRRSGQFSTSSDTDMHAGQVLEPWPGGVETLEVRNTGSGFAVDMGADCTVRNCRLDCAYADDALRPRDNCLVENCYIHAANRHGITTGMAGGVIIGLRVNAANIGNEEVFLNSSSSGWTVFPTAAVVTDNGTNNTVL